MKNIVFFICALLMAACRKEVNTHLPKDPSRIVISSFISPQDTKIWVFVSSSNSIFSQYDQIAQLEPEHMKDSKVILSDGVLTKQLIWDAASFSFYIEAKDFPIKSGQTYYLEVTGPDGQIVTAQTSIPLPVIEPVYSYVGRKIKMGEDYETLRYKIKDDPSVENYYRFYSTYQYIPPGGMNNSGNGANHIKADTDFNGDIYEAIADIGVYASNSGNYFEFKGYFLSCSKAYYNFYKSTGGTPEYGNPDGLPFGEPSNVYTNIQGGFGIFAGYNKTILTAEKN